MSGRSWLILWALILALSTLFWILLLSRTYQRFKALRSEIRKLITAIGELRVAKQSRITRPDQALNEEGR